MADTNSKNYRPTEDEPYMNQSQRDYFRRKLISWRDEILRGSNETLSIEAQERHERREKTYRDD